MRSVTSQRRRYGVYAVLLLGWWTTVATSPAEPYTVHGAATAALPLGSRVHVTVTVSHAAVSAADGFRVSFDLFCGSSTTVEKHDRPLLRITPDDARLTAQEIDLGSVCLGSGYHCDPADDAGRAGDASHLSDDDAGSSPPASALDAGPDPDALEHYLDRFAADALFCAQADYSEGLLELCPKKGACDLGFTIERESAARDQGRPLIMNITAVASRAADGSFFLPDDESFPHGSTVQVRIDE